jgi:hypothetical protein
LCRVTAAVANVQVRVETRTPIQRMGSRAYPSCKRHSGPLSLLRHDTNHDTLFLALRHEATSIFKLVTRHCTVGAHMLMRGLRFFLFRCKRLYVPSHVNFVLPISEDTTPHFEPRSCSSVVLCLTRFCGSPVRRDMCLCCRTSPSPAPHVLPHLHSTKV